MSGATVDRSAGAAQLSWREYLLQGELEAALSNYLRFGPEEAGVQVVLEDLHDVLKHVKAKAYNRAERALSRITDRPAWFDWAAFEQSFSALREAAAALEERETDSVHERLQLASHPLFAAEVANVRGTAFIFAGDFEAARDEFDRCLKTDPKHYRAVTNLGNAALESGDLDAAIDFYQKAIALNADFPNAHHNLGVAWRKKGNIARSISALKAGQKAQQRFEQAEAREQLGKMTRNVTGSSGAKYMKWLFYALVAAGVYWFLSSRGTI